MTARGQQTPSPQDRDCFRSAENPSIGERVAEIKAALPLSDAIARIAGIRLEPSGSGVRACCPFHRESTPSFFVDDSTGRYKCFGSGCGVSGDVLQFIREWYSADFAEALRLATELACLPPPQMGRNQVSGSAVADRAAWRSVIQSKSNMNPSLRPAAEFLRPVPENIPLPRPGRRFTINDPVRQRTIRMVPTHVHEYRSVDGSLLCVVLRSNARDGRKFFIQTGWNDKSGNPGWSLVRFPRDVARPVYGLSDFPDWASRGGGGILLVDGEKTRDAAASLLPHQRTGVLSLSAMGGGAAVRLADWSSLTVAFQNFQLDHQSPIDFLIWPDADKPATGRNGIAVDRQLRFAVDAAGSVANSLQKVGYLFRVSQILPPTGAPGGWDLADALGQGWTTKVALSHLERFRVPLSGFDDKVRAPLQSEFGMRIDSELHSWRQEDSSDHAVSS